MRRTHASVYQAIIGSDNGMSLVMRWAITWNSDDYFAIGTSERDLSEIIINIITLIQENLLFPQNVGHFV